MIYKGLIQSIALAVFLALAAPSFGGDDLTVKVSQNGRYFVQNGKPFFWLGDTIWSLFNYYTAKEAEDYLERRSEQGFTVEQVMIPFNGGPRMSTGSTNAEGQEPFLNSNPDTPNEVYFKNVDRVIEAARKRGLILAVYPMGGSGGSFVEKKKVFTKDNARAYGRWVANRYKQYSNIIWVNGFDLPAPRHPDIAEEFAAGLKEGDGGARLITLHPGGGYSSSYFHQRPWLAYNTIQVWSDYWRVHPMVLADYLQLPAKPVVMAESAYEDGVHYPLPAPITPLTVRKAAYWSYMAGGFTTYGHTQMWRKHAAWRHLMDSPGALQMMVLKDIFTRLEWWKLIPDQSIFVLGAGSDTTLNASARSQDGDFFVVYLSSQTTVTLDMTKITAGKTVRATWVNPQTGVRTAVGEYPTVGKRSFTTPTSSDDGVLLVEAVIVPKP